MPIVMMIFYINVKYLGAYKSFFLLCKENTRNLRYLNIVAMIYIYNVI